MRYVKHVGQFARLLYRNSYMIRSMVVRDIRARYVGSFLGFFWSIIHPLTQLLLYYFVFAVVMKVKLGPEYGGTGFALWLIAGLLPWMLFAESVMRAPGAVLEQANLIKQTVFPSELFPVVHLTAAAVNHLIAVAILVGVLVASGHGISAKLVLIVPYLALVGTLILGISWLLSALNVFLRDIGQVLGVVVNIWFFLTPIFYPRGVVPDRIQWLYGINPMLYAVEGYRAALLGQADLDLEGLGYLVVTALVVFVLGGLTFKKLKPAFADVL
jgi:ABC-type polysaccharide/polyol phosphate export permease